MKKVLLIIAVALGLAATATAQPKSIGLRFGYSANEIAYQHFTNNADFVEVDLGIIPNSEVAGFRITGLYNWNITSLDWSARGEWNLYGGPGLSLGTVPFRDTDVWKAKTMIGLAAQIGLEYTFWFPLQLSLDLRPCFGFSNGTLWNGGLYGFVPAITASYRF